MDYSLLVGVDDDRKELVFGIIDYLRQYTWDKQLETWVKASIVPKNELPTVISPREYKKRFRKFMTRYFLSVPHCWKHEHRSPSCIICSDGKRNSAKVHNAELSEKSWPVTCLDQSSCYAHVIWNLESFSDLLLYFCLSNYCI